VGTGTNVYAPVSGVVTGYTWGQYHGHTVEIRGDNGQHHHMFHNSQLHVSPGQRVNEGQLVAKSGGTGQRITGPHLHWGVATKPLTSISSFNDFINPLSTIKGGDMADKINLSTARILADGVLGRDGMDGRANALSGAVDGDLNQNHVGKDLTNEYIYFLYTSGEGSGFRNARVANTNTRIQLIEELRTALANEQKKPPKEVIKEVEKIIEKPVEVVKVETVYTHDQETKNMITSIFNYFVGQFKTFQKYVRKDK